MQTSLLHMRIRCYQLKGYGAAIQDQLIYGSFNPTLILLVPAQPKKHCLNSFVERRNEGSKIKYLKTILTSFQAEMDYIRLVAKCLAFFCLISKLFLWFAVWKATSENRLSPIRSFSRASNLLYLAGQRNCALGPQDGLRTFALTGIRLFTIYIFKLLLCPKGVTLRSLPSTSSFSSPIRALLLSLDYPCEGKLMRRNGMLRAARSQTPTTMATTERRLASLSRLDLQQCNHRKSLTRKLGDRWCKGRNCGAYDGLCAEALESALKKVIEGDDSDEKVRRSLWQRSRSKVFLLVLL